MRRWLGNKVVRRWSGVLVLMLCACVAMAAPGRSDVRDAIGAGVAYPDNARGPKLITDLGS